MNEPCWVDMIGSIEVDSFLQGFYGAVLGLGGMELPTYYDSWGGICYQWEVCPTSLSGNIGDVGNTELTEMGGLEFWSCIN